MSRTTLEPPRHCFTAAELAAYLRVSERSVSRMVLDGCPSLLVGSRRRFEVEAVLTWTRERTPPCPQEKMLQTAGTLKSASVAGAFTDAYRRVQLRVTPSASKPT